jgi:RNA-directed DNA polymerase
VQAYLDCRANKRNTSSALQFEQALESRLWALYQRLVDGTYKPGRSICFAITRPKPREVWAVSFEDRIVHHLFYNHVAPRFHAAFSVESCACIPGRGTLYGAKRLEHHVRSITHNWTRQAWYLKLDIANFFGSIDKLTLFALVAKRVHEPWWLNLARVILFHDPRQDVEVRGEKDRLQLVPKHKSLFAAPPDKGLPIGNLYSQFLANVLLNELDQFIKHRLRLRYVRYVDDMVLLHESPQALNQAREAIEEFLRTRLKLQLNPRKTILQPVARGIDFVGQVIAPHRRTLRRRTLNLALQRIEHMPAADLHAAGNSYLGLARQGSKPHGDQARIARALRSRGHAVAGDLGKVFPLRQPHHPRSTQA